MSYVNTDIKPGGLKALYKLYVHLGIGKNAVVLLFGNIVSEKIFNADANAKLFAVGFKALIEFSVVLIKVNALGKLLDCMEHHVGCAENRCHLK